ncbi:GNAT family N-acetyltransferase [Nonomuraea sp. LPB2021202275-12-8]|uniref:GNAT family N-acetyltransferase n=1 Tax=Nonomuraea sp. LPB2021202275-12-8 TaxID=3120159 RepID=UPI00300C1837
MLPITLRPVLESDLTIFDEVFHSPEATGALQWFGYRSRKEEWQGFAENGLLSDDGGTLTVCAGDQVAGRIQWFKAGGWAPPATSWCWTIAIMLVPDHRGRGIGTEAQRQLATYLFDHTRAHRIQAYTDAQNHAEQRALEKAGFEREGVLRQAQWRGGRWHDQLLYARLRSDADVSD